MKDSFSWNYDNLIPLALAGLTGTIGMTCGALSEKLPSKVFWLSVGGASGIACFPLSLAIAENAVDVAKRKETQARMKDALLYSEYQNYANPAVPAQPIYEPELPIAGGQSLSQEPGRCPVSNPKLQQLWDYLSHKHPDILGLLSERFVFIIGERESDKENLAGFLAALKYLFYGLHVTVCDPLKQKWLKNFNVIESYDNISQHLQSTSSGLTVLNELHKYPDEISEKTLRWFINNAFSSDNHILCVSPVEGLHKIFGVEFDYIRIQKFADNLPGLSQKIPNPVGTIAGISRSTRDNPQVFEIAFDASFTMDWVQSVFSEELSSFIMEKNYVS